MEATELKAAGELDSALGAVTNTVTIKGKEIEVRPLVARQLSDILRKVYALKERGAVEVKVAMPAEEGEGEEDDLAGAVLETVKRIDYLKMFMTGGDEVLDILRVATFQRKEWVDNLDLFELVNLAKTVVEVNVDFFLRNLPLIQEMTGVFKETKAGFEGVIGGEPSSDSSTTGTQ